jgi:O-antigen biosynthesis protein
VTRLNPLDYPICYASPWRVAPSAWLAHVPFGMFIVDVLRPGTLVELGTDYGVSYCAFCQAVKTLQLDTRCSAVDAWQGDRQARYYGKEVLADLRKHHDPLYGGFSRLIQSTFDDAIGLFEDGSIDLLHIDGYHTYEAVKHDYETWLPKVSARGVILFHDTSERHGDFGVWKLWEELRGRHPSFEFTHGHGLGVLSVGRDCPPALDILLNAADPAAIGEFFHQLGVRVEQAEVLHSMKQAEVLQSLRQDAAVSKARLEDCERQNEELAARLEDAAQQNKALSAEHEGMKGSKAWRAAMLLRRWLGRSSGKPAS